MNDDENITTAGRTMIVGYALAITSALISLMCWRMEIDGNTYMATISVPLALILTIFACAIHVAARLVYVGERDSLWSALLEDNVSKCSISTAFVIAIFSIACFMRTIVGTDALLIVCIGFVICAKASWSIRRISHQCVDIIICVASGIIGCSLSGIITYLYIREGLSPAILLYPITSGVCGSIMIYTWPEIDEMCVAMFGVHTLQLADLAIIIHRDVTRLPNIEYVVIVIHWIGCAFLATASSLRISRFLSTKIKKKRHYQL